MRDIDRLAMDAADDTERLSAFIEAHESFIIKIASKTAKRYVSKNDDEWSIALTAFR
jgi:RNA polymerase sigma factor